MLLVGPLSLTPLDLLLKMSPLAIIQSVFYAQITGEIESFLNFPPIPPSTILMVVLNSILAFFLNVTSFAAVRDTSPVAMGVAGT